MDSKTKRIEDLANRLLEVQRVANLPNYLAAELAEIRCELDKISKELLLEGENNFTLE